MKYNTKDHFKNYFDFALSQYKALDTLIFASICIFLQLAGYYGAYINNPEYVGKFDSYVNFFSEIYWSDFLVIDAVLLGAFVLSTTPLRVFIHYRYWSTSVEFGDISLSSKNKTVPYSHIRRALYVKNNILILQYRSSNNGLFKDVKLPGLSEKTYSELKTFLLKQNPDIYFWEMKTLFQQFSPPNKDPKWPQV